MDDELLSVRDKRRFFRRLNALLGTYTASTEAALAAHGDSDVSVAVINETAAEDTDQRGNSERRGVDTSPHCNQQSTLPAMTDSTETMTGKRKTSSQTAQAKRKKQAVVEQQLLHGRRVLLVPVGPDVSRRRLEIWQDMVVKLGGSVVAVPVSKNKRAAKLSVDWATVDVVIASTQLESTKAREHFGEQTFPPDGVCAYTPEWLVYMLREHCLPLRDADLEWPKQQVAQSNVDAGDKVDLDADAEGESNDGDGSNPNRADAGEIQRVPPVRINAEHIREEMAKLQMEKDRLVQERTVAFFKNNPGFVVLTDRGQEAGGERHRHVKPETFVCQQSSSTVIASMSSRDALSSNLDVLMVVRHASQPERAPDRSAR
jgi:hypothetical protein